MSGGASSPRPAPPANFAINDLIMREMLGSVPARRIGEQSYNVQEFANVIDAQLAAPARATVSGAARGTA